MLLAACGGTFDFGRLPLNAGSQWLVSMEGADGRELALSMQEDGHTALLIGACGVSSWEMVWDSDGRALNFVEEKAEGMAAACTDDEAQYRADVERGLRAAQRWEQSGDGLLIRGGPEVRLERRESD